MAGGFYRIWIRAVPSVRQPGNWTWEKRSFSNRRRSALQEIPALLLHIFLRVLARSEFLSVLCWFHPCFEAVLVILPNLVSFSVLCCSWRLCARLHTYNSCLLSMVLLEDFVTWWCFFVAVPHDVERLSKVSVWVVGIALSEGDLEAMSTRGILWWMAAGLR